MHTKTLLVVALIVGSCGLITAEAVPLMCKAVWVIGVSCEDVSKALVNQINSWTSADGCATGGEKCLYQLVSVNQTHIFAKHTNPTDKSVDNLTFILKPHRESPACRTVGISVSAADGKTRDNGTNYCNLWNLVEGSGLTSVSLFKEITNDWMCNERSTAKCDIV